MSASSHVQTNDGNGVSSAANGEGGSAFGLVESGSYVGKDENGKKIFIPLGEFGSLYHEEDLDRLL